jgi:hypothetical protein
MLVPRVVPRHRCHAQYAPSLIVTERCAAGRKAVGADPVCRRHDRGGSGTLSHGDNRVSSWPMMMLVCASSCMIDALDAKAINEWALRSWRSAGGRRLWAAEGQADRATALVAEVTDRRCSRYLAAPSGNARVTAAVRLDTCSLP